MTYTVDSPIIHAPTGMLAEAMAWLDIKAGAETEYATELWRLCSLVGIDPAILFAQAAHETADFSSAWWQYRRNPAGIGITGDAEQNAASHIWQNGIEAARAHIVHMAVYAHGVASYVWLELSPFKALDPRLSAATEAGYAGKVRTLADLTGKWATDPKYAEKIAAKANAIFPNRQEIQPLSTPVIYNLATDYARFGLSQEDAATVLSYRFDNRNGVPKPTFIVLHIQAGTSRSSLDWWANGYVIIDGVRKKVTASSTVMIQHDGSILRIIPEDDAPWTNGDDNQPSANGQRLVSLPGNSNLYTLSIEAEGMDGSDTTAAQLDSIVWQVEKWMDEYDIPKANILRHADINSVDRPNCPGAYYKVVMDRLVSNRPPSGPKVSPIWWTPGDVGYIKRADGAIAFAFLGESSAQKGASLYASVGGAKIGNIPAGTKVKVVGSFVAANKTKWLFIEQGGEYPRVRWSSFTPRWPTI